MEFISFHVIVVFRILFYFIFQSMYCIRICQSQWCMWVFYSQYFHIAKWKKKEILLKLNCQATRMNKIRIESVHLSMKPNKKNKRNSHWCCCFHLLYRSFLIFGFITKTISILGWWRMFLFFCSFFYYCCCMFAFVFVLNTREFFWLCHDLEYVIYIIRNKNRQFLWVFHTKMYRRLNIFSSLFSFLLNDFGDNIYCKRLLRSIAKWKHTKTKKTRKKTSKPKYKCEA